jgi:hypothetical protein
LWDPTTHKIIINKDVVFDESPLIKLDILKVEMKPEQIPQNQQIKLETQPTTKNKEHEETSKEVDEDAKNI